MSNDGYAYINLWHMFDTPQEYLRFLQNSLRGGFTAGDEIDMEYLRSFNGNLSQFPQYYIERIYKDRESSKISTTDTGLHIINSVWEDLLQQLPKELTDKIVPKFAMGGIEKQLPYARIFKSPEGFFCICINNDFFRMAITFFNFWEAVANPQNVKYYTGGTALSSNDYYRDLMSYIDTVNKNHVLPPVIFDFNTEGDMVTTINTFLALKFVMCHEIAHFLNGDLNREESFSLFGDDEKMGKAFDQNIAFDKEYKADRLAYDLMAEHVIPKVGIEGLGEGMLVNNMERMFHLMFRMGLTNSTEHPHPISRCLALIDRYVERGNDVSWFADTIIENFNMLQNIKP